jgi:ABC-2 type transport system permease protein
LGYSSLKKFAVAVLCQTFLPKLASKINCDKTRIYLFPVPYGEKHAFMFLQEQRKRYFKGRKWGKLREAPISLVNANNMHISYGKGAMVFNTLAHFVGEDSLNRVLGDFLQAHKNAYPPYPTSLDLVEMLKTELPDSLQNLIADLFERVILYDNKLGNVKSEKQADGKFAVKVEALS